MFLVCTSGMKSRSLAYLPRGSEHVYWIVGLKGEVHSMWDFVDNRTSRIQGRIFLITHGGQQLQLFFEIKKTLDNNLWDCQGCQISGPDLETPSPHDGVITQPDGAHPKGMSSNPTRRSGAKLSWKRNHLRPVYLPLKWWCQYFHSHNKMRSQAT
jgi:hypothetical protein